MTFSNPNSFFTFLDHLLTLGACIFQQSDKWDKKLVHIKRVLFESKRSISHTLMELAVVVTEGWKLGK